MAIYVNLMRWWSANATRGSTMIPTTGQSAHYVATGNNSATEPDITLIGRSRERLVSNSNI